LFDQPFEQVAEKQGNLPSEIPPLWGGMKNLIQPSRRKIHRDSFRTTERVFFSSLVEATSVKNEAKSR
jgi:hypothetical protein